MAKVLKCGDVMPGCDKVIVGKDEDEVFAKAEEHARKEHNMTIITPHVSPDKVRTKKLEVRSQESSVPSTSSFFLLTSYFP